MKRKLELYRSIRIFLAAVSFFLLLGAVWFLPGTEAFFGLQFGSGVLKLFAECTLGGAAALLSILLLTLGFGRLYCSVLCPLGILQDLMGVFGRPYHFLRGTRVVKYSVFFLIAGLAAGGLLLPLSLLLPSSNFVMIVNNVFREAVVKADTWLHLSLGQISMKPAGGAMLLSWGLLLLLLVLVRWRGRIYCNSLCPVGTFLGFLSHFAWFRITMDEKCASCGACERVCKASCIDSKNRTVNTEDCVMCMNCIGQCSFGSMKLQRKTPGKKEEFVPARREFLLAGGTILGGALLGKTAVLAGKEPSTAVMPPGAESYERFGGRCVGCGLCIGSCRGKVLAHSMTRYGVKGFMQPYLDFNKGACQFDCRRCMEVCPTGALRIMPMEEKKSWRIGLVTYVKERCVAYREDIDCGACAEHCPVAALEMVPYKNTMIPKVNEALCIGCGACQNICPVRPLQAVVVSGVSPQISVKKPVAEKSKKLEAEKDFPF